MILVPSYKGSFHPCSFYMRVPPRSLQCTSISPMRWPERCYVFAWVVSSSWNLDKLRHCGPIGVFTFYCVIKITGISIEASEDKTMSPKLPPRCMTPGVSISCILRLRPASLQCILLIKARPNDRNISTQRNSTLFAQHLQAPAKRSQYLNATNSNIVDRNMLHAFGHLVGPCCDMLSIGNRTWLVRTPGRNIVARTCPNDYNI